MGAHLFQMGKRRCCYCKKVKPLTERFFFKRPPSESRHPTRAFGYYCRKCTPLYLRRFAYFRFHELRLRIIRRRGLQCDECGMTHPDPGFFDLDHIKQPGARWRKRIHKCKLVRDTKNLRVLCPNCHREKTINERK